ncbi:MAG: aminotransferase class I/II-fold pyridoxal phosphate-dependent enzyme [Anaerolineae bacterium]|nr:aminotransferase class I/II-fold pyridoxal phosphate-dependent enzyme [Anaerolineae bacterium]
MSTPNLIEEALLPYEWPGSYFIGEEEIEAVTKVLLARSPFRFYGHDLQHYADQVEAYYRERLGRKHALVVNSGTAALSIAMAAAQIGPGDEVLMPGYLWVACLSSVVRAGGIPRLVDIDNTFTMDPNDLERKINERTKAVLVVHMSGACGDIARIADICRKHNILLIEDVAQANGASLKGKPLGSFGDLAIFSFQYNKNATAGEGGMVVSDDDMLASRAWATHDLGYARNAAGRLDTKGVIQGWGQGSRMSELSAAVLLSQVRKLDQITGAMRTRNQRLYAGLSKIPGVQPRRIIDPAGDSGPFVILTWPSVDICKRMVELTRAAGVRPGPDGVGNIPMTDWGLHIYYHNVSLVEKHGVNPAGRPWNDPLNAFAQDIHYDKGTLPHMDDLIERSNLIPVPPALPDATCDRIIDIFREAATKVGLS